MRQNSEPILDLFLICINLSAGNTSLHKHIYGTKRNFDITIPLNTLNSKLHDKKHSNDS